MSLLTNMNLFLKANLLLKCKKIIHKTLVSKKINMWQIILITKKWFHKFWENCPETNIIGQWDHRTRKREKLMHSINPQLRILIPNTKLMMPTMGTIDFCKTSSKMLIQILCKTNLELMSMTTIMTTTPRWIEETQTE